ncbi:hypothetical protein Tco_0904660 [Tanacetum coccineum]
MLLPAKLRGFMRERTLLAEKERLLVSDQTDGKNKETIVLNFMDRNLENSKEWNSVYDQLRLRRMIYLVVLADIAESVRDVIGFEYCLASLSGWTKLRLPEELNSVHDTFHVSNLKKCLADASLHVPLEEIKVNKTLRFVEEPVEIMDREIRKLKRRKIVLVIVRENNAKRQKTSEHGTFVFGESSSGQDNESEPDRSTSMSHELLDEMSQTIDEARLRKVAEEMLRQRCTLGDEHQYHIYQMQNFLKNDIVWERKKRNFSPTISTKAYSSRSKLPRDPKDHALSLVNQYLLYLKKGNLRPEKIALSLHKFPAVIFPDDIEERTSIWVTKCVKKFNPYARCGIVARRANGSIVLITESDYKNFNKNDIEDMYLLIINKKINDYAETKLLWSLSVFIRSTVIWERVHDIQLGVENYQQKVNLTAPTITFPDIEKYKVFSIVSKLVYGIIYTNSKKEKRVMRH